MSAPELWLGIDLGTTGLKATLSDDEERVHASAARRLATVREREGWSEQHPDDWWAAALACLDELARDRAAMGRVAGVGLSGQMLGPVLIDRGDRALRRTPLWNDGRAVRECAELLSAVPDIGRRTSASPDPGFGAPKLLWLARHEPRTLEAADCLLLPKDFLRLRLTGERATEPSDAGGTLLMDLRELAWSAELCAAAGWSTDRLPPVVRSWEPAGTVLPALAARFGLRPGLPVAAGAGDNMAASLGVGATRPGQCAISLGTSAVLCTVDDAFRPLPAHGFLTGAHAAPDAWLSTGVVMSATSAVDWLCALLGRTVETLGAEIDALHAAGRAWESPVAVPWLAGNRTPHDRPGARARFDGVGLSTDAAMLGHSLIEGVAFQLRECELAQLRAGIGTAAGEVRIVGGGSRSRLWCALIASLLGRHVTVPVGGDVAACLGAARLARVAAGRGDVAGTLGRAPRPAAVVEPDAAIADALAPRFERYLGAALEMAGRESIESGTANRGAPPFAHPSTRSDPPVDP